MQSERQFAYADRLESVKVEAEKLAHLLEAVAQGVAVDVKDLDGTDRLAVTSAICAVAASAQKYGDN